MVLIVDSQPVHLELEQVLKLPLVVSTAANFRASSPTAQGFSKKKSAFVRQGELARIDTRIDPDVILSSGEATTCIIAVAICAESKTACICHMDGSTSDHHIQQWLKDMPSPSIYLVGGYEEHTGIGQRIGSRILEHCQQSDIMATLQLLCAGSLNTKEDGSPINCCLTVDVRTGQAYPISLEDGAPALTERHGLFFIGNHLGFSEIWDSSEGAILIKEQVVFINEYMQRHYKRLLELPDDSLIQVASTSPEHEHASFLSNLRDTYKWILSLDTGTTIIKPMLFRWSESRAWVLDCAMATEQF